MCAGVLGADTRTMNALRRSHTSERGASLAEYALLVGLVAVVAVGALSFLGSTAEATLERAGGEIGSQPSGADDSSGDETAGDETAGGDSSGGDSSGDDSSGGDSSGGDGSEAGTQPPAATKTNGTGSSTRQGNKWNAQADFTLYGTDGQPLQVGNAQAQVKVMWTYTSWDGESHTQEYKTTQAQLGADGTVTFVDKGFETKPGHNVTSVSYQIVDVFYYWPTNPPVKWDGEKAYVRIDAP